MADMVVTLMDPIIQVDGWTPDLNVIGEYTLRTRKTPEEIKVEKERKQNNGKKGKVDPVKKERKTVLSFDKEHYGRAYFMPGLWPRVSAFLKARGKEYEVVDKRDPSIRPKLDMSAFEGVTFRETQDVAVALIESLDCGIIETTTGYGKCHHGDTPILMYNGRIKLAKDIVIGDLLMGDDSTPRRVLSTTHGYGPLYRYTPVKGASYVFNDKHMLSLTYCASRSHKYSGDVYKAGDILDISIEDYNKLSKTQKHLLKAYRVGVDFPPIPEPKLDPYFVGVYLGDGTAKSGQITNPEPEVLEYCDKYARSLGWTVRHGISSSMCKCIWFIEPDIHKKKSHAPIIAIRNACGITIDSGHKRITDSYKYGSKEVRSQLLAGLLDTDGHKTCSCGYEISTKWDGLAEDIVFVARSLGLAAYSSYEKKVCTNTGAAGMYHRITIYGDVDILPLKVTRKKCNERRQIKDVLHTGFKLERIDDGEFYGFAVDGNHRYLLGDFTVTHNSQLISWLCKAYPTLNIVVTTSSTSVVQTLYEYLCKTIPGEVGVLYNGKNTVGGKRVIVTTLRSLPNIPPDKVQLVFVDECHAIGDNVAGQDLMKFCWARRFGFSASPIRNDGSQLVMESLLGPTILKMTYQEAAEAGMVTPMKYMMLQCNGCPSVAKQRDLPEVMLKRYSYWDNLSRNGAIRRFVYDLKKGGYEGQILIMVNSLEHAIQLHMMLPWFVVAYYGNADMEHLEKRFPASKYPTLDLSKYKMTSKQLEITRKALAKGTLRYVISTKVLKQGRIDAPLYRNV